MDMPSTEPVVLKTLELHNTRCFVALRLKFARRPRRWGQWTVLLGDNGVGKSTILKSLAMLTARSGWGLGEYPEGRMLRTGAERGLLRLETIAGQVEMQLPSSGSPVDFPFPTFAYGAGRGSALGGPSRSVDLEHPLGPVCTLFNQPPGLVHAETWLRDLELGSLKGTAADAAFNAAVRETLLTLLPGVDSLDVPGRGEIEVRGEAVGTTTLEGLSDGYLTMLGWICDLLARWSEWARRAGLELNGDFRKRMNCLVLIDEIDLHLHPRWQSQVIDDLRRAFPATSFVVTTHNPLTLHGASEREIFVLQRRDDTIDAIQVDLPKGADADDTLTGPWFGLPTTIDQDTIRLIERYQRRALQDEEPKKLQAMEHELIQRLRGTQLQEATEKQVVERAGKEMKSLLEEL